MWQFKLICSNDNETKKLTNNFAVKTHTQPRIKSLFFHEWKKHKINSLIFSFWHRPFFFSLQINRFFLRDLQGVMMFFCDFVFPQLWGYETKKQTLTHSIWFLLNLFLIAKNANMIKFFCFKQFNRINILCSSSFRLRKK